MWFQGEITGAANVHRLDRMRSRIFNPWCPRPPLDGRSNHGTCAGGRRESSKNGRRPPRDCWHRRSLSLARASGTTIIVIQEGERTRPETAAPSRSTRSCLPRCGTWSRGSTHNGRSAIRRKSTLHELKGRAAAASLGNRNSTRRAPHSTLPSAHCRLDSNCGVIEQQAGEGADLSLARRATTVGGSCSIACGQAAVLLAHEGTSGDDHLIGTTGLSSPSGEARAIDTIWPGTGTPRSRISLRRGLEGAEDSLPDR